MGKVPRYLSAGDFKYIMTELHKENIYTVLKQKETYLCILIEKNVYYVLCE